MKLDRIVNWNELAFNPWIKWSFHYSTISYTKVKCWITKISFSINWILNKGTWILSISHLWIWKSEFWILGFLVRIMWFPNLEAVSISMLFHFEKLVFDAISKLNSEIMTIVDMTFDKNEKVFLLIGWFFFEKSVLFLFDCLASFYIYNSEWKHCQKYWKCSVVIFKPFFRFWRQIF